MKIRALLLVAMVGCMPIRTGGNNATVKAVDDLPAAQKAAWIEKTVAALRNGEALGPNDDMDAMMAMPRDQLVAKLMDDPRFADTALAFNLYFLGRAVNQLKTGEAATGYSYDKMAFAVPQALASARAVAAGGDYFDLFSPTPPLLMAPLGKPTYQPPVAPPPPTAPVAAPGVAATAPPPAPPPASPPVDMSDADRRVAAGNALDRAFDTAIKGFGAPGALNKQTGCNGVYNVVDSANQTLTQSGFEERYANMIMAKWLQTLISFQPPGPCFDQTTTPEQVVAKLTLVRGAMKSLFAMAAGMPTGAKVESVNDLIRGDVQAEGLPSLSAPLTTQGFWSLLPNSSTNHDRKRSAYMLRTYFCDDLTPITIVAPSDHAAGQHASDPACMACHYKLDPMGGLFRNNGAGGQYYDGSTGFQFDDGKTLTAAEYTDYLKTWQDATGKFTVGYYTGPGKPHAKWKGDKLDDIWPFLRQANEVKSCLVRRLAEYFLGPAQVYDGDWLTEVGTPLKAGPQSGAAFKQVVASLVLSKTFSTGNPEPGVCYDFASDDDPTVAKPPCAIASIVKNKCATCHSDAPTFGVDFTQWKKLDDGTYAFAHLDAARTTQLSRKDSFKIIMDRLTSGDPAKRMPKGGNISDAERQTLFKWLDQTINANP